MFKKRRIEPENTYPKILVKLIEVHPKTKNWLVEWNDRTRTWEMYDAIKDTKVFRTFIESKMTVILECPYIS